MKKNLLLLTLLAFTTISFSQETEDENSQQRIHELRLDGLKLIAGPIAEASYEFVKNENSGYGISILANLGNDSYDENFSITPFYRMYFFNKQDYGAKGFFVEGFGKLSTGENEFYDFDSSINETDKYTDVSLGMSLGKKWVNLDCYKSCEADRRCKSFAHVKRSATCWLKSASYPARYKKGVRLGIKEN